MSYWKQVHQRAFAETLKLFGFETRGRLVLSLIAAIVIVLALLLWGSPDAASDEFVFRLAGAGLVVLVFPFAYAWNFLRTPGLIHSDQAAEISQHERAAGERPKVEFVVGGQLDGGPFGDIGFSTFVSVRNSSSATTAENVQVTANKVLLANGHVFEPRRKLACMSTKGHTATLNPGDYDSFRIYTIFTKIERKGSLGEFADGSFQPMDAGKHFVELVVTARGSAPDYAVFHLDIDDKGYGMIGGLVKGRIPS